MTLKSPWSWAATSFQLPMNSPNIGMTIRSPLWATSGWSVISVQLSLSYPSCPPLLIPFLTQYSLLSLFKLSLQTISPALPPSHRLPHPRSSGTHRHQGICAEHRWWTNQQRCDQRTQCYRRPRSSNWPRYHLWFVYYVVTRPKFIYIATIPCFQLLRYIFN